ncbi:hypothetical protein ACROYT_G015938 [Oculina patagonica]
MVRLGMYFGYIGFTPALLYGGWQVLFTPNRGALCVLREEESEDEVTHETESSAATSTVTPSMEETASVLPEALPSEAEQNTVNPPLQPVPCIEETASVLPETLPSGAEQNTASPPLQLMPYVKKALRASRFNRLEEQAQLSKEITLVVGTKVICSLDLLLQLFAENCWHPGCQLTTTVSHTLNGTGALIKWMLSGVLANNLQACAAVLLSGSNFSQVERFSKFLGLSFVSSSTFCRAQRVYLVPAINEWWTWQQGLIHQELQGQNLVVMGDGQFDSPGFTAKNLCYFLMEMTTGFIIDLEVLDKREVENHVAFSVRQAPP